MTDDSEIRKGREILREAGLEGRISDDELVALMRGFRERFGERRYRPDATMMRAWSEDESDDENAAEAEYTEVPWDDGPNPFGEQPRRIRPVK
jgi:hypothetical protein